MTLTETATATWPSIWRTRRAFWWILLSALAIAVFAPLPYALNSLADLAGDDLQLAANYVDRSAVVRLAFHLHVGFGGLVLAPHSLAGPLGTIGFGLLVLLWATFAATAFPAIRRRDMDAHGRWMIRMFSLTYAAVTLR
jgi:uncharacterized membrane protein YhaH (DUF805 family)